MAARPQPMAAATRSATPVTDREKARALLALLGPEASKAGLTVPQDGSAPIPPADLRAIARDLIAQVERRKTTAPAVPDPQHPTRSASVTTPSKPKNRPPHRSDAPPAPTPPQGLVRAPRPVDAADALDIPTEAPETAEAEGPPLVLSDEQMILPTFTSTARTADQPASPQARPSLFSKRAPLTLSVPRGEAAAPRLTLSTPSGFTPDRLPADVVASPALDKSRLKALVARTVKPHRLGAEHPAIVALTLDGLAPLDQATALRKLPHGQRRRIHRALRQIEAAPT
ncbi:MAG: hypothetical protein AAF919_07390 [Pseudomonadota bacterium]